MSLVEAALENDPICSLDELELETKDLRALLFLPLVAVVSDSSLLHKSQLFIPHSFLTDLAVSE